MPVDVFHKKVLLQASSAVTNNKAYKNGSMGSYCPFTDGEVVDASDE